MHCKVCNRSNCHEVIETNRRVSDATTGSLKYKTATVFTKCTNCDAITEYATTGPLTMMGAEYNEQR
jgi:hypothetical protein